MSIFRAAPFVLTISLVVTPGWALAQSVPADAGVTSNVTGQIVQADEAAPASAPTSAASISPVNPTLASTFTSVGGDLHRMFSKGSLSMAFAFAGTALAATHWDRVAVGEVREVGGPGVFTPGNQYGSLVTQLGLGFGTFAVGKATGNSRIATTGSHLIRAQIASQIVVQGLKYTAGRSRPDASNQRSFPSGHTASAFATATVLQRDFGWKVGIPAYAAGVYVAASRMGSNKHFLSDVLIGAAIGITAGRSVTVGSGRAKFDLGLAAANGGAAVTFTRK